MVCEECGRRGKTNAEWIVVWTKNKESFVCPVCWVAGGTKGNNVRPNVRVLPLACTSELERLKRLDRRRNRGQK